MGAGTGINFTLHIRNDAVMNCKHFLKGQPGNPWGALPASEALSLKLGGPYLCGIQGSNNLKSLLTAVAPEPVHKQTPP